MRNELRLFGGLRPAGGTLAIDAPEGARAEEIKAAAIRVLSSRPEWADLVGLARVSALADDGRIYLDDEVPPPGAALALLPPVSGG